MTGIAKIVEISDKIRETTHGAIVIQLEIARAASPELVQTKIRATLPKIGADIGSEGGVPTGNFGRRNGALKTRDHSGFCTAGF